MQAIHASHTQSVAVKVRRKDHGDMPGKLCGHVQPSAFTLVDHEIGFPPDSLENYWWKHHSGYALAVLLYYAEYSLELQQRDLKFFADLIVPNLGSIRNTGPGSDETETAWHSFMTDNGTPIELSWDWGTKNHPPTIRYSIEPVGQHAGTAQDQYNSTASLQFQKRLLRSGAEVDEQWYSYFARFFDRSSGKEGDDFSQEGHASHIFYAFDLARTRITSKAYFFPSVRARADGHTNLEAIFQAIQSAPRCRKENTPALKIYQEFASEPRNKGLEHDMLAIDLVDPAASRLKIYIRSRETTFRSVVDIITLGGRLRSQKVDQGILDLSRLWNLVFEVDNSPDHALRQVDHRTAGILYNVEFKLGSALPTTKIYMPVRHYSANDEQIIRGLNTYLEYHQRAKYMPNYFKAMNTIFSSESMKARTGVQTYLGCSIRHDGTLRIVSYIKPESRDW